MEKNPNKIRPEAASGLAGSSQNAERDPSVMLNGGNPIQLAFDTHIQLNPFNKNNFKKMTAKPDGKLFPAGLKGLPDSFLEFAVKIEPVLFEWLANAQNMAHFVTDPVKAVQQCCEEKKMQLPADIREFLQKTRKANAALKYSVPGVQFKKITASIEQVKK